MRQIQYYSLGSVLMGDEGVVLVGVNRAANMAVLSLNRSGQGP